MSNNLDLMVTGSNERFKDIFKNSEFSASNYQAPTEDDMENAEKQEALNVFAEFFDLGDGLKAEDTLEYLQSQADLAREENLKREKEQDPPPPLEVLTEEEFEKEYEDSQYVYTQKRAEEEGVTPPDWSKSTDTVVDPDQRREHFDSVMNKSESKLRSSTQSSQSTNGNQWGTSTGGYTGSARSESSGSQPKSDGTKRKAIDDFDRMHKSVQHVSFSGKNRDNWNQQAPDDDEAYFAQFSSKVPFWKKGMRKAKRFLKSGKGRITMKMAVVIALQMSMAVFGKKYEFENAGQMAIMFSLMLASFFMTRELSQEGFDVTGMIF